MLHFKFWGLPEVGSVGILMYHVVLAGLYLGKSLPLGALGFNTFNHPWIYQVSYVFPSHALVHLVLSKFLV